MALYLGNQRVSPNMITSVSGVTPSGTKLLTDTTLTDVSLFQYAQVSDGNLVAGNIKKGVSILGITGTLEETTPVSGTLQITSNGTFDVSDKQYAEVNVAARLSNPKTVVPKAISQTVLPDQGDDGLSQVTVSGDSNLVAGNIKKDVSIFGVTGTLESGSGSDTEGKIKLLPPTCWIDWDADTYYVLANPYTGGGIKISENIDINGEIITRDHELNNASYNSNSMRKYQSNMIYNQPILYDLSSLNAGSYEIKSSSKFKYVPGEIYNNGVSFNDEQIVAHTRPVDYLDSDYSNSITYSRFNYTNTLNNLKLINEKYSGTKNLKKYDSGKLVNFNPIPLYDFNLDPSGNGKTDINTSFTIIITEKSDDFSLICNGYYSASSFAKISFTLSESQEVKVKYQISKSSSDTPAIVIGAIDTNYTSFSYYYKLSNPVVNFSTATDFEEKEYSFGTLAAGDHFYFVQFYSYGSDYRNNWSASIKPVFEKISLGTYLPGDITVTSDGDFPVYEYDAKTGEFSIPMTGNITMTATGRSTPLDFDSFKITPTTWDVESSILTWDTTLTGVTYHIQTPDGQEYTTTEKSFDFTGKLGESNGEYKRVKIWATPSDTPAILLKLIYNPGYNTLNRKLTDEKLYDKALANVSELSLSRTNILLETGEYVIYSIRKSDGSGTTIYRFDKSTGVVTEIATDIIGYYKPIKCLGFKDNIMVVEVSESTSINYLYVIDITKSSSDSWIWKSERSLSSYFNKCVFYKNYIVLTQNMGGNETQEKVNNYTVYDSVLFLNLENKKAFWLSYSQKCYTFAEINSGKLALLFYGIGVRVKACGLNYMALSLEDIKALENSATAATDSKIENSQNEKAYRRILDRTLETHMVENENHDAVGYTGGDWKNVDAVMLSMNGYIYFKDRVAIAFIKISDLANKVCTFKDPPTFTKPVTYMNRYNYHQIGENRIFMFGNESGDYDYYSFEMRYNSENNTIENFNVQTKSENLGFAMPPYNGRVATKSVSYLF